MDLAPGEKLSLLQAFWAIWSAPGGPLFVIFIAWLAMWMTSKLWWPALSDMLAKYQVWRSSLKNDDDEHVKRAYGQADAATQKLFDFLNGQVRDLTAKVATTEHELEESRDGHAQCRADLAAQAVVVASVKTDNTNLTERVSALSASNDKMRKMLVRLETKSPGLFDDSLVDS